MQVNLTQALNGTCDSGRVIDKGDNLIGNRSSDVFTIFNFYEKLFS